MTVLAKIKNNSLITGSAVYLLSNILNAAIPFGLLPILTRYLAPSEYGEVAMFQTLLSALAAFTGLNVQNAANRKYYDPNLTNAQLKKFIGSCLQILACSSLLVFFAILPFRNQLSEWLGLKPQWVMYAVATSAANFIIALRLGQWQVRKQAKKYGELQISQSLTNMLLSLLLVIILLKGAEGRITAQIYTTAAYALLALYFLYKDGLLEIFSWTPKYIKETLRFGVPLIPHVAGIFFLGAITRLIINAKLGLAQAGIYMVAVQLSGAMGLIVDAVNKAYVPWLFERLKRDIIDEKREIVRYTYIYFVLALTSAGLSFIIGPYVVSIVAGTKYVQAGPVFGWLMLGQAFSGMYLMVTNYIYYSKHTSSLSATTIFAGVINVALVLALIENLNIVGAAIAFSVAMGIRFGLTWWAAQKCYPMPWFEYQK